MLHLDLLGRQRSRSPRERGSLAAAVREAGRFDRSAVSGSAGLLGAIPVAAMLALGTIAWSPAAGATIGAGAMLVGIAWRIRGGQPPLAVLAADAVLMSIATFVGSVTGSITWLHLVVLFGLSLIAGLLVVVGNRGGILGGQAVIAAVVYGRFSQSPADAAALGGLVLAGGLAQVVFLSIVQLPSPLRAQRSAAAAAYRVLSDLAIGSWETSTLPVGAALDEALDSLSSLALFGDPAVLTLRSLVNEGYRMRIELSAIHSLIRRQPPGSRVQALHAVERMLEMTARALQEIAWAIEGEPSAGATVRQRLRELSAQSDRLVRGRHAVPPQLARRLSALAGQLRAAGALAAEGGADGRLRDRRPLRHVSRPLESVATVLAQLRDEASLQSQAGRHALRLAVVVVVAELISRHLPLQRGYWVVVAAALTLRPEFGATFTRGTERALATCIGVGLAGLIAVVLHPGGAVTIALVGLLAWAGYAVFPASFAAGFTFITALVVFLLNAISPDTLSTAGARLLDTLVGGALGLLVYAAWPTWSDTPARQALADLVAAFRAYIGSILATMIEGRRADETEMRELGRQVRLARTAAESTVARSLTEPATRRIDAAQSQGTLSAMRRLVQAGHVLRLSAQEDRARVPLPSLAPLAVGVDRALTSIDGMLRASPNEFAPTPLLPDLRGRYTEFERSAPIAAEGDGVLDELDEVVDASNGLAGLVGLSGPGEFLITGVERPSQERGDDRWVGGGARESPDPV